MSNDGDLYINLTRSENVSCRRRKWCNIANPLFHYASLSKKTLGLVMNQTKREKYETLSYSFKYIQEQVKQEKNQKKYLLEEKIIYNISVYKTSKG